MTDLNRAATIAKFPADEIPKVKQRFPNAHCPFRFTNSVIDKFQEKSEKTEDCIISPGFFDVAKKVVLLNLP